MEQSHRLEKKRGKVLEKTIWDASGLRRTPCRAAVLRCLAEQSSALSEKELTARLAGEFDRTTFYRTLRVLEEKEIIHRIMVDPFTVKYALSAKLSKKTPHGHFHCAVCGKVVCLDDIDPVRYVLPTGAIAEKEELTIHGKCAACVAAEKRAALEQAQKHHQAGEEPQK